MNGGFVLLIGTAQRFAVNGYDSFRSRLYRLMMQ
jgi:hypothetical protein